jgi:hypothetical protein
LRRGGDETWGAAAISVNDNAEEFEVPEARNVYRTQHDYFFSPFMGYKHDAPNGAADGFF